MKRGFLRNGLGLVDNPAKTVKEDKPRMAEKGEKLQERSLVDKVEEMRVDNRSPSSPIAVCSQVQDGVLQPEQPHGTVGNLATTQVPANPVSVKRFTKFGYKAIPFGIDATSDKFDTLCITYGDNRSHLRAHPGHSKYLSPGLPTANNLNVEIVPIENRGLGMVAKRDIPRGTILMRERPLVTFAIDLNMVIMPKLPKALRRMNADKLAEYYGLHNCHETRDAVATIAGINLTNAFGITWPFDGDEYQSAIFKSISRVNYNCSPNVNFDWDHKSFCGTLVGERDIKEGEEITVSYIDGLQSTEQRRAELYEKYQFHCGCVICSLPKEKRLISDRRREILSHRLYFDGDRDFDIREKGFDAYIKDTFDMLEAEGLHYLKMKMLTTIVKFAYKVDEHNGRYDVSPKLARRAIRELKEQGYEDDALDLVRMQKILHRSAAVGQDTTPVDSP